MAHLGAEPAATPSFPTLFPVSLPPSYQVLYLFSISPPFLFPHPLPSFSLPFPSPSLRDLGSAVGSQVESGAERPRP